MAITFPRTDILSTYGISPEGYKFELGYRQETSRQSRGVTIVKDLGTPLWRISASSVPLVEYQALDFEAMIASLDGGIHTFYANDLRRPFPAAHPNGDFDDDAVIASVGSNRKSLSLSDLDAGFTLTRGDYLSFAFGGWNSLHQIMETVTANGSGVSPVFEVRPHLAGSPSVGTAVRLKSARTTMMIMADSIAKQQINALQTVVSFQAVQCPE